MASRCVSGAYREGWAPEAENLREWRACQLEIEQTVLGSRDIFRQEEKGVSGGQMINGGETTIKKYRAEKISLYVVARMMQAS